MAYFQTYSKNTMLNGFGDVEPGKDPKVFWVFFVK